MSKPSELLDSPPYGEMLICSSCWGEYSASKGDYWQHPEEDILCCEQPMELVVKTTVYDPVVRKVE